MSTITLSETSILVNLIAATGLQLLVGFTGLLSLGHAAFMGVGAYTSRS